MEGLNRFYAIMLADLRERVRSTRFWLAMAAVLGLTWLCFPSSSANYVVLGINNHHRGAYSSSWIGMVLAMVALWTSLIGFYAVRGNLVRDFETRVWDLLEVTPLSRTSYLLAKWCSHMLVLAMVLLAQLAVGLFAQWWRAEDSHINLLQLAKPMLVLGLPSLALTATMAIWFDLVPLLRRTLGNAVYLLLWILVLVAGIKAAEARHTGWISDPRGMAVMHQLVHEQLDEQFENPRVCGGCGFAADKRVERFTWSDWQVTPTILAGRLLWLALSLIGVALCAPWLDSAAANVRLRQAARAPRFGHWIDGVLKPLQRHPVGTMLHAELTLALHGHGVWWWLSLLAALAVQLLAPRGAAIYGVMAAWVLLGTVYARPVLREIEARTAALVFSAPGAAARILFARWFGAITLGVLATTPIMLRLCISEPKVALAVLVVGVSIATWCIALGAITRTARVAEVSLFILVYLGTQGMSLLNPGIAPGWSAMAHGAALPMATLAMLLGWSKLVSTSH